MKIRSASPEDVEDILRWRNDPHARAMSRNGKLIDEGGHREWFARALADHGKILLIGVLSDRKIGMVRFDRHGTSDWEVSIVLAPEERAKKLGKPLLRSALDFFRSSCPEAAVTAEIKRHNFASLQLFKSVGFAEKSADGEMLRFSL